MIQAVQDCHARLLFWIDSGADKPTESSHQVFDFLNALQSLPYSEMAGSQKALLDSLKKKTLKLLSSPTKIEQVTKKLEQFISSCENPQETAAEQIYPFLDEERRKKIRKKCLPKRTYEYVQNVCPKSIKATLDFLQSVHSLRYGAKVQVQILSEPHMWIHTQQHFLRLILLHLVLDGQVKETEWFSQDLVNAF